MKLEEQFLPYCDHEYANRLDNAENCVDVANEYITNFNNWLISNCCLRYGNWYYKQHLKTIEQLLIIYK